MSVQDRERNLAEFSLSLTLGGIVTGIISAFVGADTVLEALVFAFTMLMLSTFAIWEVIDFVDAVHDRRKRVSDGMGFRNSRRGFDVGRNADRCA